MTSAQVALAWVGAQPAVTSVILGARTVEQLRDNLAAADLELPADQLERLSSVSAPQMDDYPYGPAGVDQRHREHQRFPQPGDPIDPAQAEPVPVEGRDELVLLVRQVGEQGLGEPVDGPLQLGGAPVPLTRDRRVRRRAARGRRG